MEKKLLLFNPPPHQTSQIQFPVDLTSTLWEGVGLCSNADWQLQLAVVFVVLLNSTDLIHPLCHYPDDSRCNWGFLLFLLGFCLRRGLGNSEVLLFVCNQGKSCEILMFVCLQKDAKQCCEVAKARSYSLCWSTTGVVDQHNEYDLALWHHSIVWCLFGDKQTSKSYET